MSENLINDDPMDSINLNDLDGWTKIDSDGMRKASDGKRLERNQRSRDTNPWVGLAND